MRIRELPSSKSKTSSRELPFKPKTPADQINASELKRFAAGWILDCEIRHHSNETIKNRKLVLEKLWWHCEQSNINTVDRDTVRNFLAYAASCPTGGRWGNPRNHRKVSNGTIASYHRILRAFVNWISHERKSPLTIMENIAAPIDRPDEITPFTRDQVKALLHATKTSDYPQRDLIIVQLLFDTGMRASELCSIKTSDVDIAGRCFSVVGKGNKKRTINYGTQCAGAMWKYLETQHQEPHGYLFNSERGMTIGNPFTRSGLGDLIVRLAKKAGLENVRASPHTFRHTFAVEYLKNGGDQFSLMQILGHTDSKMTARYVHMAKADAAAQHRRFSPADNLK